MCGGVTWVQGMLATLLLVTAHLECVLPHPRWGLGAPYTGGAWVVPSGTSLRLHFHVCMFIIHVMSCELVNASFDARQPELQPCSAWLVGSQIAGHYGTALCTACGAVVGGVVVDTAAAAATRLVRWLSMVGSTQCTSCTVASGAS